MFHTIELFSDLSERELEDIRRISRKLSCQRGETIFQQGDFSRDFYVIETGQVEILVKDLLQDLKQITVLKNGDMFGEMALFSHDSARSATAKALQTTSLIVIPGTEFERLLKEKPGISFKLLGAMSKRLKETTTKAVAHTGVGSYSPEGKIISVASPRSGTGKTTFALTMAHILSHEQGKRTLYVDLDLTFSDGTYFMGVYSIRSLVDMVLGTKGESISWDELKKFLHRNHDALYTLPGPVNLIDGEKLEGEDMVAILKNCRKFFDYIVIDTESHITDPFLNALDMSDRIYFLVDAHDLYAVKSGARFFQGLKKLNLQENRLALFACNVDVSFNIDQLTKLLKFRVAGKLPSIESYHPEYGQTAFQVNPKSDYCEFLRALLESHFQLAIKAGGERGFFARLFSKEDKSAAATVEKGGIRAKIDPEIVDMHISVLLKYVRACLNSGDIQEAEAKTIELLDFCQDSSLVYLTLGEVLAFKGDSARAIEAFRKAVSLDPDNHLALGRLAILGNDETLFAKTLELLDGKIKKSPSYPDLRNDLGGLYLANGKAAEAIEPLQLALTFNPGFTEAQMRLAEAFIELGKFHEAIDVLNAMKEKNARGFYLLGTCFHDLGLYTEARRAFGETARINPNYRDTTEKLESLNQYFMKVERLLEMHRSVTEKFPNYPDLHLKMGVLLALTGNREEAKGKFQKALEMNPNLAEARRRIDELDQGIQYNIGLPVASPEHPCNGVPCSGCQIELVVGDLVKAGIAPRILERHLVNLKNIRTNKEFDIKLTLDLLQAETTKIPAPDFCALTEEDVLVASLRQPGTGEILHSWPISIKQMTNKTVCEFRVDLASELPEIIKHLQPVVPPRYFQVTCDRRSIWEADEEIADVELMNVRTRVVVTPHEDDENPDKMRFIFADSNGESDVVQGGDILQLRLLGPEGKEHSRFDFLVTPDDVRSFSKTVGIDRSVAYNPS
ncbi:MAG: tetratricopeptide repeat protein [Candidatus Ozemobacteraceae bacterium]